MSRNKPSIPPAVGILSTYSIGGDSYAVEIIEVTPSLHKVKAINVKVELLSGSERGGDAQYKVTGRQIHGDPKVFTRRSDGTYRLVGGNYGFLTVGEVEERRDESF